MAFTYDAKNALFSPFPGNHYFILKRSLSYMGNVENNCEFLTPFICLCHLKGIRKLIVVMYHEKNNFSLTLIFKLWEGFIEIFGPNINATCVCSPMYFFSGQFLKILMIPKLQSIHPFLCRHDQSFSVTLKQFLSQVLNLFFNVYHRPVCIGWKPSRCMGFWRDRPVQWHCVHVRTK